MKIELLSISFLASSTAGWVLPGLPQCGIPAGFTPTKYAKLPDPFLYTNSIVRSFSKLDWQCRRAQIGALIQKYELGTLPSKPSQFSSSYAANVLTINAGENGKSISFNVSIKYPTTGTGPFPAVIAMGGASIPIPAGAALLTFNNDQMAQQNSNPASRGVGLFYTLYGSNATAGAMMAWAWGVSRIMDALEATPSAKIKTTRVAVTGCSRDGKGALVAGAFEERIALTIPQEPGSGGDACWRLSDYEQSEGYVVQTGAEIAGENVWFSKNFDPYSNNTDLLPFDHHELAGMVAPRGMISFENTAYVWLSPQSSYTCMQAAQKVWDALGVSDHHGFSQDGNHSHCAFPAEQQPELTAYFDKFLFDKQSNTNVFKTSLNVTFNEAQWIDWSTPHLL